MSPFGPKMFTISFLLLVLPVSIFAAEPTESEIRAAMRRVTDFMMGSVSNRGGFLYHYSADLSKQWGEVPARKSQIWVQPPGTPTVGVMLLEAYKVTRDPKYMDYAERVARALIWGQNPAGGWHYLIDFDMPGLKKWYDEVASQCRGWEEFYYYYGNCTFDDDTTASAARFLLRFYTTSLNPQYKGPLLKALDFVLQSQYPNGAWPQRYPLRYDFSHEGLPDYTSYFTYNDGVISNNIYLLLEAHERLGNEEYKKAARRGMDFYIISQLPSPQAGWAEQYDMQMRPAWARSYEPAALYSGQTVANIKDLESFYLITGDKRYLGPIPAAIKWLENSRVDTDPSKRGTHATFYEFGTNKPLYAHHEAKDGKIVRYWVDYEPVEHRGYGMWKKIDLEAIKKEFARVSSFTPQEAMAEKRKLNSTGRPAPTDLHLMRSAADSDQVGKLISSMDGRGAWITDIEFLDTDNYIDNPPLKFKGIDTATYISNMYTLINYLRTIKR